MIKLIKLELQRINLRTYIISSAIIGVVILVFTYFITYVAQVEQESQFMTYENIFRFTSAISILLFGILSATMYSRLIIEEYSGKRMALLFSYPVSRKKIFEVKVLIVYLFVLISMLICTVVPIAIFAVTEFFSPIVSDTMTSDVLTSIFKMVAVSLIAVSAIGLIAVRIGFIKKSVSVTLISAFVFSGLYGNIAISSTGNFIVSLMISGVSLIVIFSVVVTLSNKINLMEVE
ncbi:ABC transporter permease [Lacrimispora sp.]|uniref:ABC transporter permease n=1 Tax=Lacrimispora sp. TaxID=2719234 RepID=UPI00285947BC|nr:ABC transporter permease [Lacrimispora sp.]MDR7811297.1 ABC transporter permease [Lacrimispora sp.]